jgi:phosphomannomutase
MRGILNQTETIMDIVRTLKTGISGVRGVVGESLTPQLLIGFAQAFGTYLKGGIVVIGRDTRPSGEMVQTAIVGGLLGTGCEVVDVGIAPVPTVQMAVRDGMADGGVVITASHNPQQWNALKFIRGDGVILHPHQMEELLSVYYQGNFSLATVDEIRSVTHDDAAVTRHMDAVLALTDAETIAGAGLKVLVDCVNGAGSVISESFLKALGCEVVVINDSPNGIFPHSPEPIPENLWQLEEAVKEYGADIGFAHDADADRLAIVSEEGKAISEEFTLAFACDAIADTVDGPFVTNLSTSRMIDDVAKRHGKSVVRSKVGEVNVVREMQAHASGMGGEGNGGVIWARVQYCRDSIAGMALILEGLARQGGTVTQWADSMWTSEIYKTKMECRPSRIQPVLLGLREFYADAQLDLTEGIKVLWDDGSWLHVRPSNTEPIIRIIAEADTWEQADEKANEAMVQIHKLL